jgi:hypothetical protein
MAYQQTTATSVEDLINKVATFASGLGWTIDRNTIASGNRTVSISRAGSDYLHVFNVNTTELRLRASTGINTGLAVASQPGVSTAEALANCGAGPFATVFLFGDTTPAPYIHCSFDIGSGVFRHFTLGQLQKVGSWTGGTYFDAMNVSNRNLSGTDVDNNNPVSSFHHVLFSDIDTNNGAEGAVRCDVDGNTNYFAPISAETNFTTPVIDGGATDTRDQEGFFLSSVNSWSGVTPLRPIKLRVERASGFFSEIGYVPGMRLVNISRWAAGDEFSIGPDTWKVFPWWRQGSRPGGAIIGAYSGQYGYAFLKTI